MSGRDAIRQEIESHIADTADDLIAAGVPSDEAYIQARAQFGNVQRYEKEIVAVIRKRSLLNPAFVASVAVVVAIVISLGYWLKQYPLSGVLMQPILLAFVYLGIFVVVVTIVKWLSEYWGIRTRAALWSALLFGLMVSIAITIMHDLDKVLIPLHATILATSIAMGLMRYWSRLPVFFKQVVIYGFAMITTWSALHGKELFRFIQPDACLYLTRDTTPLVGELAHCQQLAFFHPLLWPIYFIIVVGLVGGVYFLVRFWRNQGSALSRKLAVSAAFAALPLLSVSFHDINNYGAVDIISWKPEIYQAYQEVLGRNPEQKDIDFYTYTRAYQTMSRVKDVLHQSFERTLVIDNLHRAILGRSASPAEIEYYVQGRQSVGEIQSELERQHALSQ